MILVGYGFLTICLSQFHFGLYIVQEPSYIGKNAIVFNMVENDIDSNNNVAIQECSHLDISTKYQ